MTKPAKLTKPFQNKVIRHGVERLDQLLAHPSNYRLHPDNQQQALAGSIDDLGFIRSLTVNERTGRVLDGHARVAILMRSGVEEVPAEYVDLSEEEEAQALLSLDPIAAMAATDKAKLDELMRAVQSDDERVQTMLAEMAEKEGLEYGKAPKGEDPGAQVDKAQELLEKWQVKPGDLFKCGEHRIICGDCTDWATVERVMQGEKADTVLTDPPYGIDFDTDYTKLSGGNFGTQKRNNHPRVVGDDKEFDPSHLMGFKNIVLWGANCYPQYLAPGAFLVWDKRNAEGRTLFSDAEIGWMNKGHGCYIFSHKWDGLNRESERGEHYHPTQKPAALWEWVIAEHIKDAAIVYEPYCGAGGVVIACERLGRKCRAIEISPAYVSVALERYFQMTGQQPELIG